MNHNKFILSPVKDILVDVTSACIGIGSGVETYPLCDYVMQSALLKMGRELSTKRATRREQAQEENKKRKVRQYKKTKKTITK